jgi:Leucine-rich repeat (LRR) protein
MKTLILSIACLIPIFFTARISAHTPHEFSDSYNEYSVKNSVNAEFAAGLDDPVLVVFNDPHLEEAVRVALEKSVGDIYNTDMETLTSFTAENDSISDLTGLEYALNLTELALSSNLIVDLTPLQGLSSLTRLELYNNKIVDLTPLINLTTLSYLNLNVNQISSITPLQYLINLETLFLDVNPISDFTALQHLINLSTLLLNRLDISDLSILQNLINLKALYLENNNVSDLTPLQNLNQLKVLFISSNQISDLTPLQNMTSLDNIKMTNNQISDISPLQNLTNLYQLILRKNQLSDISAVQHLINLQYLNLGENQIGEIAPVQNLTKLTNITLNSNRITDIAVLQNLSNLTFLNLSNNTIPELSPLQELTGLTSLWISDLQLKDISFLQNLVELERLGLDGNPLDNEDLATLYDLDKLTALYLRDVPGVISGTNMQSLADNLDMMNCEDIRWDEVCGVDPNKAVICWCEPSDSADVEHIVTVQATATDTNQAQVQMKIAWGDGTTSDYTELKANASTFEFSHSYSADGNYGIRVIAENEAAVETEWSESYTIFVGTPIVSVETETNFIKEFSLKQNFPNPFNPVTTIRYDLPKAVKVKISIYNMRGQKIKVLENKIHQSGSYKVQWNGKDEHGNPMSSGLYMCRIQAGETVQSIKLMLIR